MEPINWILFAVFIVIVIWKFVFKRRGADAPPKTDQTDTHRP